MASPMTRILAALCALFSLSSHSIQAQSTLATVLANRGDLDSFNELLDASGFSSGILRTAGADVSIFAPNDDAFNEFPAALFTSLLDSEWSDHTTCFVSYHTIEGSYLASMLPQEVTTLDGDSLTVSGSNPTQINQANIIVEDIVASNGVAHILDDVLMPACVTTNIYQQLNTTEEFSILASLLETAGLVDLVATTAPITLFAPPNQAWQAMGERFVQSLENPENFDFLKAFLMNHIVSSGNWYQHRLDSDKPFTLATTLGTTAFFYNESLTDYITNSEIVSTDMLASNGVIHTVSPVTILAALADLLQNAQVITNDNISFSNFTNALKQANFFDALFLDDLNAPRTTTVFAPDDTAFALANVQATLDKLLDEDWSFHLREWLRYHMSDGTIQTKNLQQLTTLSTLTNFSLTISTGAGNVVMVDNATIIHPNLVAYNGVIHGLDSVLFPPSLVTPILSQIQANAQFSTFYNFVQMSESLDTLLQGSGPMTVFIPTNAAFEVFEMNSTLVSAQDLAQILAYHISLENVFLNKVENQTSIPTVNGQDVLVSTQTLEDMEDDVVQYINDAQVLDGGLASNGVLYVLDKVLVPELATQVPTTSPAPTITGHVAPTPLPTMMKTTIPPTSSASGSGEDITSSASCLQQSTWRNAMLVGVVVAMSYCLLL